MPHADDIDVVTRSLEVLSHTAVAIQHVAEPSPR